MRVLSFVFIACSLVMCGGIIDPSDGGASDSSAKDTSADNCTLQLSSYSTSCNADADCVHVWVGDACASSCFCPNAAINMISFAHYQSDFQATKHGAGVCACPAFPPPACCGGTCQLGSCDAGH